MKVLAIDGNLAGDESTEPSGNSTPFTMGPENVVSLVDSLVETLGERGTVGTVTRAGPPTGGIVSARGDGGETLDRTDRYPSVTVGRGEKGDGAHGRGVEQSYRISPEGEWEAAGRSLTLDDALDRLARTCEYAIVVGFPDADLPAVVIGDGDVGNANVIARVSSPTDTGTELDVDVEAVIDALEETDPYETLGSLVARVKRSADEDMAGAIATFTGRVRTREDEDDDPTEYLEFERYDSVADERMATIREELESREGVYEVLLHHKTGVVEASEDIVFVVVLAGHRQQAFRAVEDGINRLKEEVPLFKKEVTVNDEFWAHTGRTD